MPYFRGVEIFVVTGSESAKLPEFPHPDGSSVRLMRAGTDLGDLRTRSQSRQQSTASNASDTDPTRQKTNPRISVYIPSSPGDQFRLRYLLNQSSLPSRYVFFKMYINRHHTVSWGVDSANCSEGSVSRSLCEPGLHYYRGKKGDARASSIETRYFHFMHGLDKQSIAEDGGVIEVQVFRCQGRKRVAVELNPHPYRHQQRYGVISTSGGLVENPQDATFYEYHLEDPRDSPYATFCFHYRSRKYLEQLNIIPQQEIAPRPLPAVPDGTGASSLQEDPALSVTPTFTHQFTFNAKSLDIKVFDNNAKTMSVAMSEPSGTPKVEDYFLKSPPQLSPPRASGVSSDAPKQTQKHEVMAEFLQRPLPEVPKTRSRAASGVSVRSACPSLTPSLKQYVENEEFEKEEIQLCTAQSAVFVPSESTQALDVSDLNSRDREDNSCSDYEVSSISSKASQSPGLPSPGGYVSTTGSALEHDLGQWDSPITQSSPKSKTRVTTTSSEADLIDHTSRLSIGTLKITESEWLRRTPSPRKRRGSLLTRLWSPHLKTRSGRSSMVELPGCDNGSFKGDKRSKERMGEDNSTSGRNVGHVDASPKGNWI
ncbi:hypothetical protein GGR53DRAFT_128147 [Hypoxylon sp. FL1150]|nr:hypothetical protein GGR53DRAFT_128147 [Hypoxylon sp. FL1150]